MASVKEVTPEVIAGPKWNVGTQFRWKRGIFTINAEIVEIEPPNRVLWTGRTLGIKAFHYWVLKEITSKTLAENYEEWFGIVPRLFKGRSQRRVENSLRRELEGLKRAAETL